MPQNLPGFSLVGATATGKTALALKLAEWLLSTTTPVPSLNGVLLLSADSRQIYQGLEIISGADVPADFTPTQHATAAVDPSVRQASSHYFSRNLPNHTVIEFWGVSVLSPKLSWSAAQFQQLTRCVIERAQQKNRAMILVGGTGLYQNLAFKSDWQISVPPDAVLRKKAEQLTVTELQQWLTTVAPERLKSLNQSDVQNPRRLVRQLELAQAPTTQISASKPPSIPTLGLTRSQTDLPTAIHRRVLERLKLGAKAEFLQLDLKTAQPMVISALGVKELKLWATEQITDAELVELWTQHELQYAKRQLTWWKKQPGVEWLDAQQPDVLTQAQAWITRVNPTLPNAPEPSILSYV